jgi:hypothetical protein
MSGKPSEECETPMIKPIHTLLAVHAFSGAAAFADDRPPTLPMPAGDETLVPEIQEVSRTRSENALCAIVSAAPPQAKPNVLLIVADDLGLQLSCYGDKHTLPNSAGSTSRGGHRLTKCLAALFIISAAALARADDPSTAAADRPATESDADHEIVVAETHAASLKLRDEALRKTIAGDSCWPHGAWGETLWALAALQLNEKVDAANARLLKRANDYIALHRSGEEISAFRPEEAKETPWTYFALTDYVRTLCLFHGKSPHFPGRLHLETEAAMKEALWFWVSADSRIANAGPDDLFLLLGTENHDLTQRPNHYLVTALLKEDPAYRDRTLADGHTVSEHAAVYTTFFREWPRSRARVGLWAEVGSNTYQKYSWPALFNLHELAPDPVIRNRFGLLLDLAFIEEAQISVKGRRGGGRSRGYYDANGFESYKNLLYAPEGQRAGSSHSRVIETSRYQLPAAAILLRKRAFPAAEPFVIRNRVLGELETARSADTEGQRLAADSALVNYAYRTPHYLLGSTLQNPALTMPDPASGASILKYAGISRQNRTCGLLFDDPSANQISQVHPVAEHTGGGRSQHSFWSVQHENVLLLQRIARLGRSTLGSYNTGRLGMRFEGRRSAEGRGGRLDLCQQRQSLRRGEVPRWPLPVGRQAGGGQPGELHRSGRHDPHPAPRRRRRQPRFLRTLPRNAAVQSASSHRRHGGLSFRSGNAAS